MCDVVSRDEIPLSAERLPSGFVYTVGVHAFRDDHWTQLQPTEGYRALCRHRPDEPWEELDLGTRGGDQFFYFPPGTELKVEPV